MDRRTFITSSMALAATPLVGLTGPSPYPQNILRLGLNWGISTTTLHRDSYLRPGPIRYLDLNLYHWPSGMWNPHISSNSRPENQKVLEYCPTGWRWEGFQKLADLVVGDGKVLARNKMGQLVQKDLVDYVETNQNKYPLHNLNISLVQEGLSENTQLRSIRLHTGHDTPERYYLPVFCLAYAPQEARQGSQRVHVLKTHQLFTLVE